MSNKAKVVVLKICCQAVGFLLATSVLQQGKQLDTLGGMLALGEGQRKNKLGLQQGHRAHRGCAGHGGRRGRGPGREGHVAQAMFWDRL